MDNQAIDYPPRKNIFNRGVEKENEAGDLLKNIFRNIRRSAYGEFYDYSTIDLNGKTTFIEVKWIPLKNRSTVTIKWNKIVRLFNAGNFLIYIMTPKGELLVTPDQLLSFAHIHYVGTNDTSSKKIIMGVSYQNNTITIDEPQYCRNCIGRLNENIIPLELSYPIMDKNWIQPRDRIRSNMNQST
jgi:hypothetical protein